eukprot:TRINITY_DN8857_c0_g1_i1.p1 TRINITY_DN8857_c0_g1~~TRINITY_DN8857_c0_g1_i1.p1  ORF type:complete len:445 (-),score=125.25 TRINITY_DN8857_c0_g1_i1:43-1341(-)
MVSDFFYPNIGGVELHQYQLAHCLIQRGNKVVVLTHQYGNRRGVRFLSNGIKVYYLPMRGFYNQASFPAILAALPIVRHVLLHERIDVVHCHQAFSALAHESILHARTMGLPVVFTDHSLFGFRDASSIIMNKLLEFALSDVSHVICVSHTCKENTCLRAELYPSNVSTIPNAVDATQFTPDPSACDPSKVTIVVMSRLVYRKGIDLVIGAIPIVCEKFSQVQFLVGGDGPKRLALEEMREKYQLQERVTLLGEVSHSDVRSVLVQGDIFLNSSLTEAFCIAIVEAACCGLMVVSTRVGGVPEVLPHDIMRYADPTAEDVAHKLCELIPLAKQRSPWALHERVKKMYNWFDVAERTEAVYDRVAKLPSLSLLERLKKFYRIGPIAGKVFAFIGVADFLLHKLMEWLDPKQAIEAAVEFDPAFFLKKKSGEPL